jgi:hypothetical protein
LLCGRALRLLACGSHVTLKTVLATAIAGYQTPHHTITAARRPIMQNGFVTSFESTSSILRGLRIAMIVLSGLFGELVARSYSDR